MNSNVSGSFRNALLLVAFLGQSLGLSAQSGAVVVGRAPTVNGLIDGSVQVLTAGSLTINSGGAVTGDLWVPGTPRLILNGSAQIGATLHGDGSESPSGWQITLNSGASVGRLVTRDTGGILPAVAPPPVPVGNRDVAINSPAQTIGDFSTLRNLTLNSGVGAREIPPGTYGTFTANQGSALVLGQAGAAVRSVYHFQRLTLNSGSELRLLGPVEIVLANAVSLNAPMGNSEHPEWLDCRIASGGLTLNSPARFHGYVVAPHGAVVLNSQALLTGGVHSDRLTLNSGSRLIVLAAAQPPPELVIVAPASGGLLPRDEVQVVMIENGGGPASAGVELWVDDQRVGQTSAVPGSVVWQPDRHGVHWLQARTTMTTGDVLASAAVEVRVVDSLPLVAGFESVEGFVPGPIANQQGWGGVGDVLADSSGGGRLRLPAASGREHAVVFFAPVSLDTPLFAGVFLRPFAAPTPEDGEVVEFAGARVAFVRSSNPGEGEFLVFAEAEEDGAAGAWRRVDQPSPVSLGADGLAADWLELSFRYDNARNRWDLHVDGMAVIADVKAPLVDGAGRWRLRFLGNGDVGLEIDDVFVDRENRAFPDADRDGMDDGWERYYGIDPTRDDRAEDADGDGLSNIIEFVLWTDPTVSDSDGDGLSDATEHRLGLDPLTFTYPTDDDEDGRTQIEELQSGTDPNDFFDGHVPALAVISEPGDPDGRLVVKVSRPGGEPWLNAPVRFAVGPGEASLATNPDSTITHQELELRSDEQGLVTIYLRRVGAEANP